MIIIDLCRSKLPRIVAPKAIPKPTSRATPSIRPSLLPSLLPRATNRTQKGSVVPNNSSKPLLTKARTQKSSAANCTQTIKSKLLKPATKNSRGKEINANKRAEVKTSVAPKGSRDSSVDSVKRTVRDLVGDDEVEVAPTDVNCMAPKLGLIHSTPIGKVKQRGGDVTKKVHTPPKFTPILSASNDKSKQE